MKYISDSSKKNHKYVEPMCNTKTLDIPYKCMNRMCRSYREEG
uniref:Uncharacterized protein n=1 Tax=Arundo donax TaxID=35708 RepID=A0A0A8ZNB1_ARUDO